MAVVAIYDSSEDSQLKLDHAPISISQLQAHLYTQVILFTACRWHGWYKYLASVLLKESSMITILRRYIAIDYWY